MTNATEPGGPICLHCDGPLQMQCPTLAEEGAGGPCESYANDDEFTLPAATERARSDALVVRKELLRLGVADAQRHLFTHECVAPFVRDQPLLQVNSFPSLALLGQTAGFALAHDTLWVDFDMDTAGRGLVELIDAGHVARIDGTGLRTSLRGDGVRVIHQLAIHHVLLAPPTQRPVRRIDPTRTLVRPVFGEAPGTPERKIDFGPMRGLKFPPIEPWTDGGPDEQ